MVSQVMLRITWRDYLDPPTTMVVFLNQWVSLHYWCWHLAVFALPLDCLLRLSFSQWLAPLPHFLMCLVYLFISPSFTETPTLGGFSPWKIESRGLEEEGSKLLGELREAGDGGGGGNWIARALAKTHWVDQA